jgi:hypothetical protein
MKMKKRKVTIKKYEGDDMYSWAMFLDGMPVMTGLGRSEAQHYKRQELKKENRR